MKLLDLDTPSIQIHEYVALEYDHETAVGCRDFWRKAEQEGLTEPCNCGSCKTCACILCWLLPQTGTGRPPES